MELGADVDPRQPDPVTTWKFYQPFRCHFHCQYSSVSVLLLCYRAVTHLPPARPSWGRHQEMLFDDMTDKAMMAHTANATVCNNMEPYII